MLTDAGVNEPVSAFEKASRETLFLQQSLCELSERRSDAIRLSSTGSLKQATTASNMAVTLSGDHLFSSGGQTSADHTLPTIAVTLSTGRVHAMASHSLRYGMRKAHTLTGLSGPPRAVMIGGISTHKPGQSEPAVVLSVATETSASAALHAAPIEDSSSWPQISGHSACVLNHSGVAVFGGRLHGQLDASVHVVSELADGRWSWRTLPLVSIRFAGLETLDAVKPVGAQYGMRSCLAVPLADCGSWSNCRS